MPSSRQVSEVSRSLLRLGVRNAWETLNATGRFEVAKEIFDGIDVYNLSRVNNRTLLRLLAESEAVLAPFKETATPVDPMDSHL